MAKLLTKRKQKWIEQRRSDTVMRGTPLKPPIAVEVRYRDTLQSMIQQMAAETRRKLERLYDGSTAEEYFAQDAGIASQAKKVMRELWKKYDAMFKERAKRISTNFVNQIDSANSASVHKSLKQLSGGLSLGTRTLDADTKEVLKASIAENVSLIKSIPQKYLGRVEGMVMRSITHPEGRNYLDRELAKSYDITKRRAKFIASDQTRKANAAISAGRLQKLGVKKFEWIHVPNSHPRELHEKLDGKIFEWDNPPEIQKNPSIRGYPAQLPGCHCEAAPVFEFDVK